jgi:hypothetical protein
MCSTKWFNSIDASLKKCIHNGPNYQTFEENKKKIVEFKVSGNMGAN